MKEFLIKNVEFLHFKMTNIIFGWAFGVQIHLLQEILTQPLVFEFILKKYVREDYDMKLQDFIFNKREVMIDEQHIQWFEKKN